MDSLGWNCCITALKYFKVIDAQNAIVLMTVGATRGDMVDDCYR